MSDTRKDRKVRHSVRKAMLPRRELRAMAARHGVSRMDKAVSDVLNNFLMEEAALMLKSAALNCDARKRSTLSGQDAKVAIVERRTIPLGLY